VRKKMEGAFGQDFSGVRIHESSAPSAFSASAYAQGEHLHFAPGQFDPSNLEGQAMLGHELTHVVQQRAGRVAKPHAGASPVNSDGRHEAEAHVSGLKAALGERVALHGPSAPVQSEAAGGPGAPVQLGKYNKAALKRHARAYERARFYHATRNANVASIAQTGLDPGRGGSGAAQASGVADFVAHSQNRVHVSKSRGTGRFYRDFLGGRANAQILRTFARRSMRHKMEDDPDSDPAMKAYRTAHPIKGKYIRPENLSALGESSSVRKKRERARYKAIRSNYHGVKPNLLKIKRIHQQARDEGYVSD
jgi:hypothetical protein